MTVVDRDHFPTVRSGLLVRPRLRRSGTATRSHHAAGQLLAALVMLLGIGFLTVITAAITSTFVSRARADLERTRSTHQPKSSGSYMSSSTESKLR